MHHENEAEINTQKFQSPTMLRSMYIMYIDESMSKFILTF